MGKEIVCTIENEGFLAHYYPGTKSTNIAIISVGGAACDEKTSIAMSRFLRKEGYNVLVLGFYLWKGLSKNLAGIPIDFVEKAVNWLKNEQGIEKIAMTGASTGAGYTLNCAVRIPEITCVIPVVPFDYVGEGTDPQNRRLHCSVYTFHGEEIPYVETPFLDKGMLNWLRSAAKAEGYGLRRFMRYGYDKGVNSESHEHARIKVENMNADVLLLAVENDDCWPSEVATRRMMKILEENNYPHRYEAHIYEKASHGLVDGIDEMGFATKMIFKLMIPSESKYPKECEEARLDSMKRIIRFIDEWSR